MSKPTTGLFRRADPVTGTAYPKDIPLGYLGRLDRNANDLVAPAGQVTIVAATLRPRH